MISVYSHKHNKNFVLSRTKLTSLAATILFIAFLVSGCQKINDATTLGSDLIPAVDNVSTFDTTLSVQTYNGLFTNLDDSTIIGAAAEHFAGNISNDPLFGKTNATMYFELKPSFPYTFDFGKIDSLLQLDSVVLVLNYTRTFGDSLSPLNFSVKEIAPPTDFRSDSNYLVRSNNFVLGATLGSKSGIIPASLDDTLKTFRDTATNQLRIPLDNSFGMRLLSYDTSVYNTDSVFHSKFRGFALVPDISSGNAILGFNLQGANTKLAFYYHYKNGKITDTATVSYFNFNTLCAHADLVERDYTGSPMLTYQGGTSQDDLAFVQSDPGSFVSIKIPDLKLFPNRIIHRAELIAEQVYDPTPGSDNFFSVPDLLFLDAYDTAAKLYRTVPYDFIFDPVNGPNYTQFGMIGKTTKDIANNPITVWKFDLTRYVQNYLTRRQPLYDLRLFAPFSVIDLYNSGGVDISQRINLNSLIAAGRVRLAGGNYATQQRMRLRIIYSKL